MPNLKPEFYVLTNNNKTNHYIETGTYLGEGIKNVLNNYETIHSIELCEKWYEYNVEQFKNNKHVKLYLGDSKNVLPLIDIQEPVTVYLDANYIGCTTEFGEEPLLVELEILKNRSYDDIIIMDHFSLLGTKCTREGDDNMEYDWTNITEYSVTSLMKEGYSLLKNDNHKYTDGSEDQVIMFKIKNI